MKITELNKKEVATVSGGLTWGEFFFYGGIITVLFLGYGIPKIYNDINLKVTGQVAFRF